MRSIARHGAFFENPAEFESALLVHSFIKKTQKTPPREVESARKRMKEVKHANS